MAYYGMQDMGPGPQPGAAPPSQQGWQPDYAHPQQQAPNTMNATGPEARSETGDAGQRQAAMAQAFYGRGAAATRLRAATAAGPAKQPAADRKEQPKKHLFSGISPVQAVATALAALTSMLLSAQIGITGSIIGVFVGSIVSTVSAQVYKNMAALSAKKIQEKHDEHSNSTDDDQTTLIGEREAQKTTVIGANGALAEEKTTVIAGASTTVPDHEQAVHHTDAYAKHAVRQARARRDAKAQTQKRVIIVSVVSALIAILLTAGIINLTTAGQGIGTKARVSEAITQAQSATDASSDNGTSGAASSNQKDDRPQQGTVTYEDSGDNSGTSNANTGSSSSAGSNSGSSNAGSSSANNQGSSAQSANSGSSSSGSNSSNDSNSSTSNANNGSSSSSGNGSSGTSSSANGSSGSNGASSSNGSSGSNNKSGSASGGSSSNAGTSNGSSSSTQRSNS